MMASVLSKMALLGAGVSMLGATPAAAAPLAPVDSWTIDYSETQCAAHRTFAADGRKVALALRPSIDGSSYEVTLAETNADLQLPNQVAGKADFGGGAAKAWVLKHRDPATDSQIHRFRVPASQVTAAQAGSEFSFSAGAYRAELGKANLGAAVRALGTCLEDLRTYWNASSEGSRPASARDNVEALLKPANYADSGMWGGVKGSARYVLFIDPAGNLAGCEAVSEDASPILALVGCDILRQRAQFTPALDQDGKPVRDVITTSEVRWRFG